MLFFPFQRLLQISVQLLLNGDISFIYSLTVPAEKSVLDETVLGHPQVSSLLFVNDLPIFSKHQNASLYISLGGKKGALKQLKVHRDKNSIQFPHEIGRQGSTGRH